MIQMGWCGHCGPLVLWLITIDMACPMQLSIWLNMPIFHVEYDKYPIKFDDMVIKARFGLGLVYVHIRFGVG